MDYPEYKNIYARVKCPKMGILVSTNSTYKYNSEKNVYILIKRSCDVYKGLTKYKKCNGRTIDMEFCPVVTPFQVELSPDSPELVQADRLSGLPEQYNKNH